MAENDKKSSGSNFGLGEIRNILMGQQMSEYEERFNELKAALETTKIQLTSDLQSTGSGADARIQGLEKNMNARLDKLEKLIEKSVTDLGEQAKKARKADQQALGKLFANMGQQLMKD